jgi:CRP-like cAMP-binding protein
MASAGGLGMAESSIEKRHYQRGDEVFAQGDLGDAAYIVETGRVTVFQQVGGEGGRPLHTVELGDIGPGEMVGEMAVLDYGRRMATAVAAEDSVLTRIPRVLFDRKLGTTDRFVRGILTFFIRSIRNNHRIFLRKPRSLGDHHRLLLLFAEDVAGFARRLDAAEERAALQGWLARFDELVGQLDQLAKDIPDDRHDLILDHQVHGTAPQKPVDTGTASRGAVRWD